MCVVQMQSMNFAIVSFRGRHPLSVMSELPNHFEVFFDHSTKYTLTDQEIFGLQLMQDFSDLINSRFYPKAITIHKTVIFFIFLSN